MVDESLPEALQRTLLAEAEAARASAYAPYSRFAVGAALLGAEGRIVRGANVENASYGLTICAERAAVAAAVAQGLRAFRAVAVVGPAGANPCWPCGACRQVLWEFAPALWVVVEGPEGQPLVRRLAELLPEAFGPHALAEAR